MGDAVVEQGKAEKGTESAVQALNESAQTQAPPDSSLPNQVQVLGVCSAAAEGESAEVAAVKLAIANKKKHLADALIQIKLSDSLRPLTKNNVKLVEALSKFGWTGN